MPRQKKRPQRMCVGCGEVRDKQDLVRVVRSPEGELSVDRTGKKSGRGAYICPRMECLDEALRKKRLQRSLKVPLDEEVVAQLRRQVSSDE